MVHQPRILVAVALLQSVILTDLTKQRFHRLGYKPILKGAPGNISISTHMCVPHSSQICFICTTFRCSGSRAKANGIKISIKGRMVFHSSA